MACPAAAPAVRAQAKQSLSARQTKRKQRTDGPQRDSSLSCDTRIPVRALQGNTRADLLRDFPGAQMLHKDIPDRCALLLVDRSPSGDLIAFAGLNWTAVGELQVGNPATYRFRGCAGIGEAASADHVAALLAVGIGVEDVVGDVLEHILDLAAG